VVGPPIGRVVGAARREVGQKLAAGWKPWRGTWGPLPQTPWASAGVPVGPADAGGRILRGYGGLADGLPLHKSNHDGGDFKDYF